MSQLLWATHQELRAEVQKVQVARREKEDLVREVGGVIKGGAVGVARNRLIGRVRGVSDRARGGGSEDEAEMDAE